MAENGSDPSGAVFDVIKGSCFHHGIPKLLDATAAIDKMGTGDGLDLTMAFQKKSSSRDAPAIDEIFEVSPAPGPRGELATGSRRALRRGSIWWPGHRKLLFFCPFWPGGRAGTAARNDVALH